MKKKIQNVLLDSLGILGYVLPIGIAAWRVVTGKGARESGKATTRRAPSVHTGSGIELESLSLSTPGDAPLDRLARIAAHEKREPLPPRGKLPPQREESVEDVLQCQALESARLPGWSEPKPDRLPIPTFAPAVMALGVVIFAMGLATVWYVCVVGSLVFAVAAWRWGGELQGE
ncbi:MAG TPA: hypothetical protein VMF91_02980 [Bryobacteraceae bacterium]|nr:hypothetical protein [Bryobacteraceae bacterium]